MSTILPPIEWKDDLLFLLDQRVIPSKEIMLSIDSLESCHAGIRDMVVRGAPCIGFTAIFGMALWLKKQSSVEEVKSGLKGAAEFLKSARPTAVNLEFEVNRCIQMIETKLDATVAELHKMIVDFGLHQMEQSYNDNLTMAQIAMKELQQTLGNRKYNLMHHCNTGYLACGKLGTALGVISHLASNDLINHVWVDETRPYLQGSRLTSYELIKEGVPHDIVVEGAASYLMRGGKVDAVFVGADRITLNGDTANKVGTSTAAVVANYYNVPFYVVAPSSSFDLNSASGDDIEIELRDQEEILSLSGHRIAPIEATALNPSFDITPGELITGIICEKGLISPPYLPNLKKILTS